MSRRTVWIAFFFMVILGTLAVCAPAPARGAEKGWARLEPGSDTYVRWRVALTMPDEPTELFIRFYLVRKHRAIERARDAHVRWVEELEAARQQQLPPWTPPPPEHSGPINWDAIAQCESGGRWHYDGRYDGGLQFHPDTWRRAGGTRFAPYAWGASRAEQIATAERWVSMIGCYWCRAGWGYCGRFG